MINRTLIAAVLSLAVAGNANAGIKDWLHKKTAPQAQPVEQVAAPAPVSAQPLTVEQQACNRFVADYLTGKLPQTKANKDHSSDCTNRVLVKTQTATTHQVDAKDLPTVEVKGQAKRGPDGRRVAKEAAKGCAIGAVMGLLGGKLDVRACAAAAIGAGVSNFQQQLAEARQVEAAAKAAGASATVKTQTQTDDKGKQHEAMQSLVIDYKPADMEAMAPDMAALLDKLARLTKADKGGLVIRFDGANPVCQIPLQQLTQRAALARHTVDNQCGKGGDYTITVSPIPDVQ